MALMSRLPLLAVAGAACAALALPAYASAEIIEIGKVDPAPVPSCPTRPCLAVSRTTGYQAKIGTTRGVMTIPKDGSLVAWTIGLGKPGKKQTTFFNDKLGGESQAQLTVLNPRRKLRSRAVAQGDVQKLTPFFGTTVQFPLAKSIPVKKGWVIALTVPTWAPALAVGLGADTSWRASRGKGTCEDTSTNTVQTQPNQLAQYYCLYKTARLAYSATLVTAPVPAAAPKPPRERLRAPAARSASRRRRARSAGDRAGARRGPARARCARGARGSRPSAAGAGPRCPRSAGRRPHRPCSSSSRAGDDLALRRRPRAEARRTRARGEVGVALGLRQALDGTLDAHRAVDLQPAEGQRRVGVRGQGASLGRVVVRVEAEAALVEPAQQDVARDGRARRRRPSRRTSPRARRSRPRGLRRARRGTARWDRGPGRCDRGAGPRSRAVRPRGPLTGARVVLAELTELARRHAAGPARGARAGPSCRCPRCRRWCPWTCRRWPLGAGACVVVWPVVVPAGAWPCVWSGRWTWCPSGRSRWWSSPCSSVPVEVCASASAPGGGRELRQRRGHDVMGGVAAAAGAQAQARDGENNDHVRTHAKRG